MLGHLCKQKMSFLSFYFCGSSIWPESLGLACKGTCHRHHDGVGGNEGVGVFSPTEAALSAARFLCSKFHYIRLQQTGGGVRRQLGYGTGTQ